MDSYNYPRIVIGGLSGDSGKTVVACGLAAYFKREGKQVSCFKKGPDYIDTAWLSLSSGKPARNLDTFLMGFDTVKRAFIKNASKSNINVIEGNRGIFDGRDKRGTHSTAELAKLLEAPLIIIQNISKVTRTSAASILGSVKMDPELNIAGVILNQVAGKRHGKVAKEAIEEITGIPVVGIIPKLKDKFILPTRHLGLITPEEFEKKTTFIQDLCEIVEENLDISKILEIAESVPLLKSQTGEGSDSSSKNENKLRIGYFKDQSFSFYYPENLELLIHRGADLIPISATGNSTIEDLDALYIGGGFPETNLSKLSLNQELFKSLKKEAENGLPIYAECGGLMYLAESLEVDGKDFPLSGVLPIKVRMNKKPQGHGYYEATVDVDNPFYDKGVKLKGHEFHYSDIFNYDTNISSALSVTRGVGCFNSRDGIIYKNVFASYMHIHALGTPEWVHGMIRSAVNYKNFRKTKNLIFN